MRTCMTRPTLIFRSMAPRCPVLQRRSAAARSTAAYIPWIWLESTRILVERMGRCASTVHFTKVLLLYSHLIRKPREAAVGEEKRRSGRTGGRRRGLPSDTHSPLSPLSLPLPSPSLSSLLSLPPPPPPPPPPPSPLPLPLAFPPRRVVWKARWAMASRAGRRSEGRSRRVWGAHAAVALLVELAGTAAHGAMVSPLSRNALDRSLPWRERTPAHPCFCANSTPGFAPYTPDGCDNGQACAHSRPDTTHLLRLASGCALQRRCRDDQGAGGIP